MSDTKKEAKTEQQHTPGPWTFEPCHTEEGARYHHICAGPVAVANTYCADSITVLGYGRFAGHVPVRHSNPGDAFLISAAPELLEALEDLLSGEGDHADNIKAARAAIDKARGRPLDRGSK